MILSLFLALILVASLIAVACAPAAPLEVAEEVAELEDKLAAEKAKVSDLEKEIAKLRVPGEVYEWRLQHDWAAVESYFFDQYADLVREMTDGRIDITIFFDGQLVPREDVPVALEMGTLDMAFASPVVLEGTVPITAIGGLPYLWKDTDQWIAAHYEMGLEEMYREAIEAVYDVRLIATVLDDYGTFLWVDDFSTLADLSGRKANTWGVFAEIMEGYGVASVSMPAGDLYTSLATGVLDGIGWGGVKCMFDMGFCEVATYSMEPYYMVSWLRWYFMGEGLWEALPSDLQAILTQAAYANGLYIRSVYAAGEKAAIGEAAEKYGLEVVTLPDEDVRAIASASVTYLDKIVEEFPETADGVEKVKDILRAFGTIE